MKSLLQFKIDPADSGMKVRNTSFRWSLLPLLICAVAFLTGCPDGGTRTKLEGEAAYVPQYATGFDISAVGESSVLTVHNPWQGAEGIQMQLFLSRGGEQPPAGFDGVVCEAPLRKVVCMSSSYIAYLDAIGHVDAIAGVSGARFVTNEAVRAGHGRGEVHDVGYDNNLNYELIASLEPDLVLAYGVFSEDAALSRKLAELGINVLYIGDYVEQSPLGKAEWVVAFGEMFGKRDEARVFFEGVAASYLQLKKNVEEINRAKPKVMLNAPYRDTWYVPGDRSYMVRLLDDAGADYVCAGVDSEQSRPLGIEAAFIAAGKADVWLNPGQALTLAAVKAENPRFAAVPAVRDNKVYNCNARRTPDGGSDFWESGAVRPDIVLMDLVKIIYPELLSGHELYYFRHLQ